MAMRWPSQTLELRVALLALACRTTSALVPIDMQKTEYFLREFVMAKPPTALSAAATVLTQLQGETLVESTADTELHPLLVPITRCAESGETTGLLRWPGADVELPVVRTVDGGNQLRWLAPSAEKFVDRAVELAEAEGADTAAALAELATSAGIDRSQRKVVSKGGVEAQVILRVGPFMREYERLALNHFESGSTQAALITCERNQACFGKWARPFAFHARMLQQLDRDEEARDVARHGLSLPLWTLDFSLDEVCSLGQTTLEEVISALELRADGKLTVAELRANNGFDKRTPQQIASQRASAMLDLVVAAPEQHSWKSVRRDLADCYRSAELEAFATFIDPDETI